MSVTIRPRSHTVHNPVPGGKDAEPLPAECPDVDTCMQMSRSGLGKRRGELMACIGWPEISGMLIQEVQILGIETPRQREGGQTPKNNHCKKASRSEEHTSELQSR